jgi:histidinol phosphatase-like PHP family hydrolase
MAKAAGAKLLVNTDTHAPEDLINANRALEIAVGAGLECEEAERAMKDHPIVKI